MDVKYDFKSEANRPKWERFLIEGLERILSEIHPTLTLTEAAALYIQDLILSKCLYPICTTPSNDIEVIKGVIMNKFPPPLNNWAITEAQESIDKRLQKNGKALTQGKIQFLVPYTQLRALVCKEFFQMPINEVNEDVMWLIAGCVEFLCVDLFRLIGSFVKNLKCVEVKVEDVRNALCADKVLLEVLEISRDVNERPVLDDAQLTSEIENLDKDAKTERYHHIVKHLKAEEQQNQRNIQMIIYVFISPLEKLENGPKEKFDEIFHTIHSLHEISNQFLPKLEETLEFYGNETPLVGDAFLEFAELMSLGPYVSFAHNIADDQVEYMAKYNEFLSNKAIQAYFERTKKELGYSASELYKYVLPRLMYNLVSHAATHFERLNALLITSPEKKDRYELSQALSCLKPYLNELKQMSEYLPKREVYFRFVPKPINGEAIERVDELIRNLMGIDEETRSRMFKSGGEIIMEGEWHRVCGTDKKSRLVFLLDGFILCCRRKGNQYRVKEWFRMREIEILDHKEHPSSTTQSEASSGAAADSSQHHSMTFQINVIDSSAPSSSTHSPPLVFHHHHSKSSHEAFVYSCDNLTEKQDWMVAMLSVHSRGTLERILDKYIAEEERKQPLRVPAPDKYCFAEPDKREGDVNIITDSKSGVSKVKEATLPKLVERLTFHLHADHAYIEDFFTTYRSFCEPTDLFNLLKIRFNIPDIEPTEEEKQTYTTMEPPSVRKFKKEYAHPVQSRVLNVMRYWINNHYEDFKKDPALLGLVHNFIQEVSENKKWKNYCASIRKLLNNQAEDVKKKPEIVRNENAPRVEWHLATPMDPSTFNLITLHPLEIARQITLIESEMFRNVTLSELTNFGCCSSKDRDQKRRMFPNVVAWQNFNNKISYWLTFSILDTPALEERLALLVRGWEIAQALEELNNFSGVLHVISGLNYSAVSRLKLTHEKLPKETKDIKHGLISKYIDSNLKFYKDALKKTNPPLVPYLGNTFTNVLHIEDSAKTHTSNTLINFSKCRLISTQCRAIMMYQPMPYNLKPMESIQAYLQSQDPVGSHTEGEWADKLYDMSLQLEPRDSNFSLKQPSSKVDKKYLNVSLKSPGIKPSPGSKMVSKLSQSKTSMSGDSIGESKITTYARPSAPNSSTASTRARSSLSNSNNSDSTSPLAPSTPKSLLPERYPFQSPLHGQGQFATIASPVDLEQSYKQHIMHQNIKHSGTTSRRHRTPSGSSQVSLQSKHSLSSAFQFPPASSMYSSQSTVGMGQGVGSLISGNHRFSTSMSPDNMKRSRIGSGSISSMSSPKSSLSSIGSTSTLVSEMGGSSVIGLSSMSLSRMGGSGGGGSQHSPASDTTPPNSSGYNKMNSQQHFAFNNAASAAIYNQPGNLSNHTSGSQQFSPSSADSGNFSYSMPSPAIPNRPPPVPPRHPLDFSPDQMTPTRSNSNDYAPTPPPKGGGVSPPEKIPPRTPLNNKCFTPPSSAMSRVGSTDSKKFHFTNEHSSMNENNNSIDSMSRRSMCIESLSSPDVMEEKEKTQKNRNSKPPMPPPRITHRRSDLGSVSSTATVETLGNNTTTPPPEIPAKTYKFPAMPAS